MRPLARFSGHPVPSPASCDSDKDRCQRCPLHQVRCVGCIPAGRRLFSDPARYCQQGECMTDCNGCGGTNGAFTPSICCKSPLLRVSWPDVDEWSDLSYTGGIHGFRRAEPIRSTNSGIPLIQGPIGSVGEEAFPEDTDLVAVSVQHVWSRMKGWISDDLKDYLQLRPGMRLFVTTCVKDDLLEDLWEQDEHGQGAMERGADVCMPITFSNYHQVGQMRNFFEFQRTMQSLYHGGTNVVPMNLSSGLYGYDLLEGALASVGNVMWNTQFTQSKQAWSRKLSSILRFHTLVPEGSSLFFVGTGSAEQMLTLKATLPERQCFFVSSAPYLYGVKGKRYSRVGKQQDEPDTSIPRTTLVRDNLRHFYRLANLPSEKLPGDLNLDEMRGRCEESMRSGLRFWDALHESNVEDAEKEGSGL